MGTDKSILEKLTDTVKDIATLATDAASHALKAETPVPKTDEEVAMYMPLAADGLVSDPMMVPPIAIAPSKKRAASKRVSKKAGKKTAGRKRPPRKVDSGGEEESCRKVEAGRQGLPEKIARNPPEGSGEEERKEKARKESALTIQRASFFAPPEA